MSVKNDGVFNIYRFGNSTPVIQKNNAEISQGKRQWKDKQVFTLRFFFHSEPITGH